MQKIDTAVEDAQQRESRSMVMRGRTRGYVEAALAEREGTVTFVSGSPDNPRLEIGRAVLNRAEEVAVRREAGAERGAEAR